MNNEKIQVLQQYIARALPWMTEYEVKDHVHLLRSTADSFGLLGPNEIKVAFEALFMSKITGVDHSLPILAYQQEERRRAFALGFLLLLDYQFTIRYAVPGSKLVEDCIRMVVTNALFTPAAAIDLMHAFAQHIETLQAIRIQYLVYDDRARLCASAVENSSANDFARILAKYALDLIYCANYDLSPETGAPMIHDDVVTFLSMFLSGSYLPSPFVKAVQFFSEEIIRLSTVYATGIPQQWDMICTAWNHEFNERISVLEQLNPQLNRDYVQLCVNHWKTNTYANIPMGVDPVQLFDAGICLVVHDIVYEIVNSNHVLGSMLHSMTPIFTPIFFDEIALQYRLRPDYTDAKTKTELGLQNVLNNSAYALFSQKAIFKHDVTLAVQLNMMREAIGEYYASMDPLIAAQQPEFQEFLEGYSESLNRTQFTNAIQPIATQTVLMELNRARLVMFDSEGTPKNSLSSFRTPNLWRLSEALPILLSARNDVISVSRPDFSSVPASVSSITEKERV